MDIDKLPPNFGRLPGSKRDGKSREPLRNARNKLEVLAGAISWGPVRMKTISTDQSTKPSSGDGRRFLLLRRGYRVGSAR
jgi:hypothetical protein